MADIHETKIEGQYPVTLKKIGKGFVVVYGHQISKQLTYAQAAQQYGECVLHALTCAGLTD